MPNPQTNPAPETSEGLTASESSLGKALALILRVLPLARQPERASEVQKALRQTAALIDSARQTHAAEFSLQAAPAESVAAEMVAMVAAAVAAMLDRPHRVISVVPIEVSVPHLNVWALEGRSQLFVSHKVR
jgi:hypothetical protein